MKYMLMMHAPRGDGEWNVGGWLPEEIQAHMGFMMALHRELTESGELLGAEGLAAPGEARIVRAGGGGRPVVTDGPYPEAKEFLAGYWIVEVDRVERAHEIAAKASSAPGPGGKPMRLAIELRQVMSAPPVEG